MKNWPKLSETLRFERHPESCQSCGCGKDTGTAVVRWIECDDSDKPTSVVVMLCDRCTGVLIEPHPRLYSKEDANAPRPAAMALCTDCKHRHGLTCKHSDLKANGGDGLLITVAEPSRGFWDGRDKQGRRTGGMFVHYPTPPSKCAGQEIAP